MLTCFGKVSLCLRPSTLQKLGAAACSEYLVLVPTTRPDGAQT